MRFVLASTTGVLAVLAVTGALAQAQPQGVSQPTMTPDTTGTSSASTRNKVVCRTMFHQGEVIRTPQCHTQREWETIRQRNQQDVNDMQMRGLTSSPH